MFHGGSQTLGAQAKKDGHVLKSLLPQEVGNSARKECHIERAAGVQMMCCNGTGMVISIGSIIRDAVPRKHKKRGSLTSSDHAMAAAVGEASA